jgi:cytidylate kinase
MNRAVAPLKPADDAITIDSTDMSIDTVFKSLLDIITDNGLN